MFILCLRRFDGEKFRPSSSTHFSGFKPRNESTRWAFTQLDDADLPGKLQGPRKKPAAPKSAAATSGVQYPECRGFTLGASCVAVEARADDLFKICEGAQKRLENRLADFGLNEEKLAEMAVQIFAVESMVYARRGTSSGDGRSFRLRRQDSNTMKVLRGIRHRELHRQGYGSRDA